MKKLFTLLVVTVLTFNVFAQAPQKMSYQAVIRDADSKLVKSLQVGMRISILQGSVNGTVVYTETQTPSTNANGLVTIEIGSGTGFDAIDWANGPYFIKTETDPTGGTNYTAIVGTSQLLSVPYALHAKTVASYPETDPVFIAHPANGITGANITNWNSAYGWGNHALAGYIKSYTETDPVFTASAANGITSTAITNWNNAFGWGNHANAGYLKSFTETDPVFTAKIDVTGSANGDLLKFDGTKYVKFTPNYISNYNETDPVWSTASANYYTKTNMQTDGQAQLHFNNIIYKPATIAGYGITDAFNGTWASLLGKPIGNSTGDMLYWNGTDWVRVPVGQPGQFLQLTASNIPTWLGTAFTLTTTAASSITGTRAISGGNVISDGGATVTARGVCWNTSVNPTTTNSKTIDGSGIGTFTSSITGLTIAQPIILELMLPIVWAQYMAMK